MTETVTQVLDAYDACMTSVYKWFFSPFRYNSLLKVGGWSLYFGPDLPCRHYVPIVYSTRSFFWCSVSVTNSTGYTFFCIYTEYSNRYCLKSSCTLFFSYTNVAGRSTTCNTIPYILTEIESYFVGFGVFNHRHVDRSVCSSELAFSVSDLLYVIVLESFYCFSNWLSPIIAARNVLDFPRVYHTRDFNYPLCPTDGAATMFMPEILRANYKEAWTPTEGDPCTHIIGVMWALSVTSDIDTQKQVSKYICLK